ncbi:MAG: MFS transporter [Clostridia bacterium]|nr:MFS transporter [Clostridia bacterium]
MTANAKKAIKIGSMCFMAYLAVYLARNILSTVTPAMHGQGFSKDGIGFASSVFFYSYAVGQLINGAIGDKIKAKYMMTVGLFCAGICNLLFSYFNVNNDVYGVIPGAAYLAYGAAGFFLAMIYGPMTKIVSENTELPYTTRCSLGYTFASYFGSPMAGLLATFLVWQNVFAVSSGVLCTMAVVLFLAFTVFERKGIITYGRFKRERKKGEKGSIRMLFDRQIVKFSFISILTGIVRTSVLFWLPTYFAERLGLGSERATLTFTVVSLFISCGSFVVLFIYERMGHNLNKTVLVMFSSAAIGFTLTYFISYSYVNIVLIVLSIMSSNGAATMLWSRYCPGLRETGIVSGVT